MKMMHSAPFLAYFIHLVAENNHIFEPLSPLNVKILLSHVFGGAHGTELYRIDGSFTHHQIVASHVFFEKNIVWSVLVIKKTTSLVIFLNTHGELTKVYN